MRKVQILAILLLAMTFGACGGSSHNVGVTMTPAAMSLDQAQATTLTATVTNDSSNSGVKFTLSCSVSSCGSLSAATSTAVTFTAPSTVASSMPVTVTATSAKDGTKTAKSVVTVNPNLAVTVPTTAQLTTTVGGAYSLSLGSGGTAPFKWQITSGTLPAGLTLNASANTGAAVISGTPTAAGSSTVTLKVTDSSGSTTGASSVSQQLTIVVTNAPLKVVTTSLPNGVVNAQYTQSLQASGGTIPYTWSVASGSSLPSWLSIGGSGTSWTISGTPAAPGTSTFSLAVTDSSTPPQTLTTGQLSVTITTAAAACGSGNESALNGQYAFSLSGFYSAGFQAYIGSFTADGKGNISAGAIDGNGVGTGPQSGTISASSYTIGSDYRGCVIINTTIGNFTTHFALENNGAVATEGALEEWEPGGTVYIAAGQILKQSVSSTLPNGVWVYEQVGSYGGARMGVVGTITASGSGEFQGGEYDSNPAIGANPHTGLTGTYGAPNPTTGRYAVTTTLSGISVNRAEYLVDGTHFLELTSSGSSILVGKAQLQSTPLTLSGNLVYYATGASSASGGSAEFGRVTISGGNTLTGTIYGDQGSTPESKSVTCSFAGPDTYGRVTMSGNNCGNNPPLLYMTGANTAVLMATDTTVPLGQAMPQTATSITSGKYYFGTSEVDSHSVSEAQVGEISISNNVVTGFSDSTSATASQQGNQPVSTTLSPNTDGSFGDSNHAGQVTGIVVSDGQLLFVDDNQNSTYPTIVVLKQAIK